MKQNAAALVFGVMVVLIGASAHAENAPLVAADRVPADNSARNERDRADTALTSGDQSSARADVAITREVRKAVVADPDLSVNAQNVKIITVGGVVTLRGPVRSAMEKASVAAMAQKVAGVTQVDNQIEIASD
ncbi:MAG: BON domain-containing protein [Candidatus Binatia bacterium]